MIIMGLDVATKVGMAAFEIEPRSGRCMRFIEQVVMAYEGDDCIAWPFGRGGKGYGYMRVSGVHQPTHRYICKRVNGHAPTPEHEASHSCGNGFAGCVTKSHLSWKTAKENASDKQVHGTENIGERNGSARLTEAQVLEIFALNGASTQQEIADRYGVNRSSVQNIHKGRKWGWLTSGRA